MSYIYIKKYGTVLYRKIRKLLTVVQKPTGILFVNPRQNTLIVYTLNYNTVFFRLPTDPSSFRYMMSFTCGDPFIVDGLEFVTLKVKGG